MAKRRGQGWSRLLAVPAVLPLAACSAPDGAAPDELATSSQATTTQDGSGYAGGEPCHHGHCEPCQDHHCRCNKDKEPPVVHVAGGGELWPPNHKPVTKTLADCGIRIYDACEGPLSLEQARARIACVTSDEPQDGSGDGNTSDDIVLSHDGRSVTLLAERSGGGDGRVYTIHFEVRDSKDNKTTKQCLVTVPHDQSGRPAVAGDPIYTVCQR